MTLKEFEENVKKTIDDTLKLNFYVRDINIQKDAVKKLKHTLKTLHVNKAILKLLNGKEYILNIFFYYQCVINGIISSLSMWINLKENNNYKAWCNLQDSIDYFTYSLKATDKVPVIHELISFLNKCETVLFPNFPLYNSAGILMQGGICSICRQPIELCNHIEGYLYKGSICKRIKISKITLDHLAIVENPDDKRCIITEYIDDDGNVCDCMTQAKLRKKEPNESSNTFHGIIFYTKNLDIF